MLAANMRLIIALIAGMAIGVFAAVMLIGQGRRSLAFDPGLLGTWRSTEGSMFLVIGYDAYLVIKDGLPQNMTSNCRAEGGVFIFEASDEEGTVVTQKTPYTLSADQRFLNLSSRKSLPFSSQQFTRIGDIRQ